MPGVDLGDQKASYYSDRRKSLKWTHKLIYRLFRQSCVNAEILFNHDRPPPKQRLSLLFFLQQALYDWTRSGSIEAISSTTTKRQRCDHEAEAEVDASSEVLGAKDHKAKWERAVKQRTTGYHFPLNLEYEYNKNRTAIIKDVRGHCKMCLHTCKSKCQQCDVFLCLKKGDSSKNCWSDFYSKIKFK